MNRLKEICAILLFSSEILIILFDEIEIIRIVFNCSLKFLAEYSFGFFNDFKRAQYFSSDFWVNKPFNLVLTFLLVTNLTRTEIFP